MGVKQSFTLRNSFRLRMFDNWELIRIFGPKSGEVTESMRKLHDEEFHNLFSSTNNIKTITFKELDLVNTTT